MKNSSAGLTATEDNLTVIQSKGNFPIFILIIKISYLKLYTIFTLIIKVIIIYLKLYCGKIDNKQKSAFAVLSNTLVYNPCKKKLYILPLKTGPLSY